MPKKRRRVAECGEKADRVKTTTVKEWKRDGRQFRLIITSTGAHPKAKTRSKKAAKTTQKTTGKTTPRRVPLVRRRST